MKTSHTNPRLNSFDGQPFEWNEFPDETVQFDTWNLNFEDDEESDSRPNRNGDTENDDDPNRFLG